MKTRHAMCFETKFRQILFSPQFLFQKSILNQCWKKTSPTFQACFQDPPGHPLLYIGSKGPPSLELQEGFFKKSFTGLFFGKSFEGSFTMAIQGGPQVGSFIGVLQGILQVGLLGRSFMGIL